MQIIGSILVDANQEVAAWVLDKLPHLTRGWTQYQAIGVVKRGKICAGFVFHDYEGPGGNINFSMASSTPLWCTRPTLQALFSYPFVTLRCSRLSALTPKPNKRARRLMEGLGFVREGAHRKAFGDETAISYGMLPEECRWLRNSNGKIHTATASAA